MTTHPPPIEVSDRWLPAELQDVAEHTFRPQRGERKVLRKRKPIQPSEWAPKHRVVTKGSRRGLWRNETVPYAPPILDAMARAHVETVNLCWSPQSAKSETINTFIAWLIDRKPGDVLFVYPDEKTSNDNNRDRHQPMITSSRRLSGYTTGYSDDMAVNRIALEHMAMYYGWASSPSSLANKPIPYIVCDETDKYPLTASKKEAGPVGLADARATVFRGRRKFIRASTPTTPTGFIWSALEKCKAAFVYWARCPLCGKWQRMELKRIRVPENVRDPDEIKDQDLAWYQCAGCEGHWDDHLRDRAVAAGQWRHREKGIELFTYLDAFKPKTIGAQLPSWYSPFVGLSEVMAAWFKGQKSKTKLKEFFNRFAAQPWVIHEKEREEAHIMALADDRPAGIVPGGDRVAALLGTVDTQDNGFWYEIRAWSRGQAATSWGVRAGFVRSRAAIEQILWDDEYRDPEGKKYRVRMALIDSGGHRTAEVYEFCRRHRNKIFPTKGERRMRAPVAWSNLEYYPGKQKAIPGGLKLVRVDTTFFKNELASILEVGPGDPGAWHFNAELTEEWARHMVAEVLEEGVWTTRRGYENHGWDCSVLQLACRDILGMRYWRKKKRKPEVDIDAGIGDTPEDPPAAAAKPARKKKSRRKKYRPQVRPGIFNLMSGSGFRPLR